MRISNQFIYHPILSKTFISVGLTSLSLLLLILVLLSVPGPIKSLYWFSVRTEDGTRIKAGVLGWCMSDTSNCSYAELSDNDILSKFINTGESLLVKTILPLSLYWLIVTFIFWIGLTVLIPIGYQINNLDSIKNHLRFTIIESLVLCFTLFGDVLSWLSYGLANKALNTIKHKGGKPVSGNVMGTIAAASFISLLSLLFAIWGIHLRILEAQKQWKEQAIMVRKRSIKLCSNNIGSVNIEDAADVLGYTDQSKLEKRLSTLSQNSSSIMTFGKPQQDLVGPNNDNGTLSQKNSIYKSTYQPQSGNLSNSSYPHYLDVEETDLGNREEHLHDVESHRFVDKAIKRVTLYDPPVSTTNF
ncbi:uncharacterized protein L201_001149 [Kwoniella dendrophila CBS 6074]|uniref:Uncharacterized protein n=1 Tax=Kwoniella dendrophila CBS 6074 TaxID=1295534 RepID=A0AAX4JLJ5_9TREE